MVPEYSPSDIKVLKGLEVIRARPEMYLGNLKNPELTTKLAFQVLCHAADEFFEGNCSNIELEVRHHSIAANYNTGMPLGRHESENTIPAALYFLMLHAACHNLKKNIHIGNELCEIGLAVLNAVSERLTVSTASKGEKARFEFKRGVLLNEPIITKSSASDFTHIELNLDSAILHSTTFDYDKIKQRASELVDKHKLPLKIVRGES